jgi:sn-1 stearoyl-lipid 9-desaturase
VRLSSNDPHPVASRVNSRVAKRISCERNGLFQTALDPYNDEKNVLLRQGNVSENAHPTYRQSILDKPTYGHPGPAPKTPTTVQVLAEWFDAISFWKHGTRLIPAVYAIYHFVTFLVFVWFLTTHFSVAAILATALSGCFIGTVYNTVWYHRFCSHQAFRFRSIWIARIFLWTNPICLREESYVIPHRIHHAKSDEPGDPYGPHLGWLGSYLATETQQKTNCNLTAIEYERLVRSLGHVGFVSNSYEQFRRTASVENIWHYLAHVLFAHLFWGGLTFAMAGWWGVWVWMSGVFLFTFLVRDFNYRGHSALTGSRGQGQPVNQIFYALIAGEWHKNHHHYPRLARSGLAWWQVDAPYWIILAMKWCGIVSQCNSRRPDATFQPSDAKIVV